MIKVVRVDSLAGAEEDENMSKRGNFYCSLIRRAGIASVIIGASAVLPAGIKANAPQSRCP
ncbi:hypothetical protein [Candidatus Endomicrobiellum agilis]|uniref:hypothetical protein n=1 Tax=Candidatus Endomicrobiellum agilis TaxID=3238957 RepID=UPI003578A753|nr:hypothetical protein [Endomicrobium sp.]